MKKLALALLATTSITSPVFAQSGPNGGSSGPSNSGIFTAAPNGGLSLAAGAFSLGDGVGITYANPGQLSLFGSIQPTGDGAEYLSQNSTTTAASILNGIVPGTFQYWDSNRSVIDQEAGATTTNMSGFGAYCYNNLALGTGAHNHACVGFFSVMVDVANGSTSWGDNYALIDSTTTGVSAGTGKTEIGSEYDFTTTSPNTIVSASAMILQGVSKPAAASGYQISVAPPTATLSNVTISDGAGGAGTSVTATVVSGTVSNGLLIEGGTITANTTISGVSVVAGALTATASISQNTTATAGATLNPSLWSIGFTVNAGSSAVGAFYGATNVSGFGASSVPIEFAVRDSAGTGHALTIKGIPVGTAPTVQIASVTNLDGIIFEPGAPASNNVFIFPGGTGSDTNINLNLLAKGTATVVMGNDVLPSTNGGEALGNASHLWSSAYAQTYFTGTSGSLAGALTFYNATSGSITLAPTTGALGTVTATLPANTGTIGELNLAETWTALQSHTGGIAFPDGTAQNPAALLGAASVSGTNIASQVLQFNYFNGSSVEKNYIIKVNASNQMLFQTTDTTGLFSFNGNTFASTHVSTAAAATTAAGQIGYGGTTAAAANCNVTSPTPTGCVVINVAGTTRYLPYY